MSQRVTNDRWRSPRLGVPLLALAAIAAAYAVNHGWIWWNHPSEARYPVRGVDVSHHQGDVDWRAVRGGGLAFVLLKATEGGDFRDPRFESHLREARRAGLAVGAYHFFTFCRPGRAQAENYLAAVPVGLEMPPVVDVELEGNCATRPTVDELRSELGAFASAIEAREGRRLVVYLTEEVRDRYGAALPPGDRWARALFGSPSEDARLWQYARGRAPGIEGPVDLDVFIGDREAFRRWTRAGATSLR